MKNIIRVLIFLLSGITAGYGQLQQYGQTLIGDNEGDRFGSDIELSADGKTLVLGVANSPDFGVGSDPQFNAGKIQVYQFLNDMWEQLGSDIDGGDTANLFGIEVAISKNGQVIAGAGGAEQPFNSTRVFELVNDEWVQKGTSIQNNDPIDSVFNLSLNEDGSILAIGSSGRNAGDELGAVTLYRFENNDWQVLGTSIYGDEDEDAFGLEVALSNDGLTFVTGALGNDANGVDAGLARVYAFNGSSWVQVGGDIVGNNTNDRLGSHVSINSVGDRISVVAAFSGATNRIDIYQNNGGNWQQVGNSIFKPAAANLRTSALNGAGDIVLIGLPSEPFLRTLQFDGTEWLQISETFTGLVGIQDIAIDDSGGIVVGSSPSGPSGGLVEAFADPTLGIAEVQDNSMNIILHPNPSSGIVTLESLDSPMLSYTIFNTNGQIVKSNSILKKEHSETLDLSGMAKGLYFAQIVTNSQIIQVKFILE
ncbi:T9SS type A sorting domain-containing protein [Rasiella rasia]|uniref:T9SS type A sorting domain-containing protein n=1 Tax=Rasiella rasia TaxID=2744027 RepID=A0A6G6GLU7_9FLAO|nr:T9SS type A sorting domain-containing protein [Rasiella rasia]QIE59555.1 T9SS type A sorting domain-containing protein [Rasiella rasia]